MVDQITLANQWRCSRPDLPGGFVVVYRGEVAGWINELRTPSGYVPGCVAVDERGNRWVALGGNDYDGAERWEAVE